MKIRISRCLYIFISYILLAVVIDIISCAMFYIAPAIPIWINIVSSLVIVGLILYSTRKYFEFEKAGINGFMLITVLLIFLLGFFRSVIPDTSYDIMNVRIFWQTPGFKDNIYDNFFPAGLTFYFVLPERLFFYPRFFLGYRLGTLMNVFVVMLIFLETKLFIDEYLKSEIDSYRERCVKKLPEKMSCVFCLLVIKEETMAFIATCTFYVIAATGTYMTDLIMLPILVYLLRVTLRKIECAPPILFFFYAFLQGIVFALKLTNVIFIMPMICIFLWRNRKYLRIWIFLLGVVLAIVPSIPYLLYCYISTGNPIFWTFNSIFKSPYYPNEDFKDTRWGPESFLDGLLWPFRLIFDPTERVTEISSRPQCFLLIGHISAIISVVDRIRKKVSDNMPVLLSVLYFIFFILWLCSTGYQRYAIILEIMSVLLLFIVILKGRELKKIRTLGFSILLTVLSIQCISNVYTGLNNEYDWSWRGTTVENIKNGKIAENMKMFFQDRQIGNNAAQKKNVDVFFSTTPESSALKTLFNADIPNINGGYISSTLFSAKKEKGIDYFAIYKEKIENYIREGRRVCDLVFMDQLPSVTEMANEWGLSMKKIELVESFFGEKTPVLVEFGLKNETDNNVLLTGVGKLICEKTSTPADSDSYIYITPYWGGLTEVTAKIELTFQDGSSHSSEISFVPGKVYTWQDLLDNIDENQVVSVCIETDTGVQINALNLM